MLLVENAPPCSSRMASGVNSLRPAGVKHQQMMVIEDSTPNVCESNDGELKGYVLQSSPIQFTDWAHASRVGPAQSQVH